MASPDRGVAREKPLTKSRTSGRLRDAAYVRLKNAIQHQELQPGQALSETHLSKILGISRTPVREAIHQLVQEGLLQVIPGRAVTVAAPSVQGILNIIHIRSLLEPEVARLLAESPTPEVVAALRETLTKMQQAAEQGDRAAWSRADATWHEILAKACPNSLLGELTLQMRNRTHGLSVDTQTTSTRILDCTVEHRRVVDGIAAQDPQAAEQAMRQHIQELRESMFRRLARS
jgi:DNA-binding GntR family transcriptional regulator